jgi:hypothetical protein
VIIVDTSGLHRGMPIRSGERYALTNYYWPRRDAMPPSMAKHVLPVVENVDEFQHAL